MISWRAPLGPPGDESRAPNLAMEAVSPSYPLGALGVIKSRIYSTVACTRHFAGSPSEPHRSAPRAKIAHYGLTPSCPGSFRNSPGRLRDKHPMDGDRKTLLLGSRDPAGPPRKRKRSGIPGGARRCCAARLSEKPSESPAERSGICLAVLILRKGETRFQSSVELGRAMPEFGFEESRARSY